MDDNMHDSRTDLPAVTPADVSIATIKKLEDDLRKEKRECASHLKCANGFLVAAAIFACMAGAGWLMYCNQGDHLETARKHLEEAKAEVAELKSTCRWQGGSAFYWYNEYQRVGEKTPSSTVATETAEDRFYFSTKKEPQSHKECVEALEAYAGEKNRIAQKQLEEWNAKKKFAEEMVKSWFYQPNIGGDGLVRLKINYVSKSSFVGDQRTFNGVSEQSGVMIDYKGKCYILTADYITDHSLWISQAITASLGADDKSEEVVIVGYDTAYGIALLKFKNTFLEYKGKIFKFADGSRLGEKIFTKNALLPRWHNSSCGMLLKKELEKETGCELLHYDAPTTPGAGGGPLLNSDGRLVGIQHSVWYHDGIAVGRSAKSILGILDALARGNKK